jgi:hypothetical protein
MANATRLDGCRKQLHFTCEPCRNGEECEASQARHRSVAPEEMIATRIVVTYHSERFNAEATHISRCPGQPEKLRAGLLHRKVYRKPSENRDRIQLSGDFAAVQRPREVLRFPPHDLARHSVFELHTSTIARVFDKGVSVVRVKFICPGRQGDPTN